MKAIRLITVGALLVLLLPLSARAADHGIFADGSYSPGSATSKMDKLVDNRVDRAKAEFDKRNNDPDDSSTRVDTEEGFENALKNINCKCGDTITIVMVGHGKKNSFKFTKEGKSLTPKELLKLLESAAIECCCKIHIVIFSCHSGSWIDDLFKDSHVQSVYTSCKDSETSTSDAGWEDGTFTDNGDWMDNFDEDWEQVDAGKSVADQMEEASKTAESKLPPGGTHRQHPQGWRRGELPVKAHVESVRKKNGKIYKMKIHFYDPEFMRCTQEWVNVGEGVDVPNDLTHCDWIEFTGTFGSPNDRKGRRIAVSGDVTESDSPPTESIVAHVLGRSGSKLKVHVVQPTWMYCTTRWMTVQPPATIAADIQFCKWISQSGVSIDDPDGGISTGGDVAVDDDLSFRVKVHIEGSKNHAKGTSGSHILAPPFLRCKKPNIKLPPGALDDLENCDNVWVDYQVHPNTDGDHVAANPKKVTSKGSRTHYNYYDAAAESLVLPESSMTVDTTQNPELVVRNAGQEMLLPSIVECTIQYEGIVVYADLQEVEALEPGSLTDIIFVGWTPEQPGAHTVTFQVLLPEDENPLNNTLSSTTIVTPPDVLPIPGDATMDCHVNVLDMIYVRNRLQQDPASGDNWRADINSDGAINILDLLMTRNHLQDDCETTPPFSRDYVWDQVTELILPPQAGGGVHLSDMHGYLTWGFEPTETPGVAAMVMEDLSGTGSPLFLQIDINDDGIPDPVDTGEIVFDIYDVDFDNTGGTVNMMTGEFSFVTTILPRAPALEAMGIYVLPEPVVIEEFGTIDFYGGTFNLTGFFGINTGLLAGTMAVASKDGDETETKKLATNRYRVDVRAAFTLLWLKNLTIPDGKVKVKAVVVVNGREVTVEGELEIEDGKSTTGLKIAGIGQLVTKVKSVEITYEK